MNRTALVTGASSGIGLCYAMQLAAAGYDLVIVSNEEQKNRSIADELSSRYSVTVYPVYKDLCSDCAANELFDFCCEKGLTIDILINNAGMLVFDTLSRTSAEKIDRIVSLHVETPTMLCKLFSEQMKQRGSGHILVMSSATARMPYPTISVYAATKSYLRSFAYSLRFEMFRYGVNVTTVLPGAVDTPLYDLPAATRSLLCRLGIMSSPEKVAAGALRAMFKGRKSYTPGLFTRFVSSIVPLIPDSFIRLIMKHPKLEHLFR